MDDNKDSKDAGSVQDFEMGPEEKSEAKGVIQSEGPKINHFTSDIKSPDQAAENQKPQLDPKAEAPEAMPEQSESKITIAEAKTGKTVSAKVPQKSANPEARRKAILGCLGGLGVVMIIFLIIALVFIFQSNSSEPSQIAQLLGLDQAAFINSLIILVHTVFVITALIAVVFTMIGLFKASMAKKEDKIAKKRGLRLSLIAGLSFLSIMIIWVFMYLYMDSRWVVTGDDAPINAIVTEPEDTLNVTAPIEIRFDGSKIPIDSKNFQVISYKWDFDDGSSGTKQIETHTYKEKDEDGRYDVTLTVTLREKSSGEELELVYEHTVTVADEAIFASFDADPQSGEAPLEVQFDASESQDPDGEIARFDWDFDEDGEFDDAEGPEAEHVFEKVGTYTVALRVSNLEGEFDIAEKEIVVGESKLPEAKITIVDEPASFTTGLQYVFKADDSTSPNGKITDYNWDFGGGVTYDTKTVNHTFEAAGTYEITLTVIDEEDKEAEKVKVISVNPPKGSPKAKISTQPAIGADDLSLQGTIPFTVNFDASGTTDSDNNIVDYEWDFTGDGFADQFGEKVSHTFTEEGTFTVTLKVIDADDNSGKASIAVTVESQGVIAILNTDKIDGNVPLTVTFDASASSYVDGSITSYEWDFGDGSSVKLGDASVTHKYTEIGTFTATVTVISSDNTKASDSVAITVREIPLTACFEPAFMTGEAPLENIFDPGCSSGTIAGYFWDFGDGSTASSVKPSHTFTSPGTYPVLLEITDSDNNISTVTVEVVVTDTEEKGGQGMILEWSFFGFESFGRFGFGDWV